MPPSPQLQQKCTHTPHQQGLQPGRQYRVHGRRSYIFQQPGMGVSEALSTRTTSIYVASVTFEISRLDGLPIPEDPSCCFCLGGSLSLEDSIKRTPPSELTDFIAKVSLPKVGTPAFSEAIAEIRKGLNNYPSHEYYDPLSTLSDGYVALFERVHTELSPDNSLPEGFLSVTCTQRNTPFVLQLTFDFEKCTKEDMMKCAQYIFESHDYDSFIQPALERAQEAPPPNYFKSTTGQPSAPPAPDSFTDLVPANGFYENPYMHVDQFGNESSSS